MTRVFGGIMSISIIGSFGRYTQFNLYTTLYRITQVPCTSIYCLGIELPVIDSGMMCTVSTF